MTPEKCNEYEGRLKMIEKKLNDVDLDGLSEFSKNLENAKNLLIKIGIILALSGNLSGEIIKSIGDSVAKNFTAESKR